MEIAGPEEGRRKHLVASIYGFKLSEGQANARLIAAAPELLEVFEEALVHVKLMTDGGWDAVPAVAKWLKKARAVLAKVRGDEREQ